MAAVLNHDTATLAPSDPGAPLRDRSGAEEVLGPILSGAYARGVVDTLDLLGIPALLLDRDGRVLCATATATACLGGALKVRARHLLAGNRKDNRALGELIAGVLGGAEAASATLAAGVTVHVRRAPGQDTLPDQLMHTIVAIDDGSHPAAALLARATGAGGR